MNRSKPLRIGAPLPRSNTTDVSRGIFVLAILSLIPTAGKAAIAPQYERVRQFQFLMSVADEAATRLAPTGPIDSIERLDDGTFRFRAGRCYVPAAIEQVRQDEQPPRLGVQTQYTVTLGEFGCD